MERDSSDALLKDDRRVSLLQKAITQHGHRKDALVEILHVAQELFGYLDKDLLLHITESLNLPPSHVYGVATFYNFFRLQKPGSHIVTFCLGTACFVRGVEQIISAVESRFKTKRGETSADGKFSLFVTRCIGACAMAPNVVINGEVIGKATEEDVTRKIESLLGD